MVDKLWYEWQLRFPGQGYLPVNNGPFGQNETDPMDSTPASPIGARPIDVLDSRDLNIEYDHLLPGTPDPDDLDTGNEINSTELIVNATATNAQISTPGEEDKYYFDVTEFSPFNIETSGASDTTLTLFGPDNETSQIAFDDDGGNNFNSLISRSLPSGRYFMSVRLFNAAATGSYQISVTSPEGTGSGTTIPEISVNGTSLNSEITNAEEIDIFSFTASTQGLYTIETTGTTDTYMNLFGPNSQSLPITENDDSGINRNSRVQVQLTEGEYFVRIRHFSQTGVGAYQIRVFV
jgi:tyrosinase